jgi:hypothetical protein
MYMLAGGVCGASRVNKLLKVTEALRGILNSRLFNISHHCAYQKLYDLFLQWYPVRTSSEQAVT